MLDLQHPLVHQLGDEDMNVHVAMPQPLQAANQPYCSNLTAWVRLHSEIRHLADECAPMPGAAMGALTECQSVLRQAVIDAPVRSKDDVVAKLQLLTDMVANEVEYLVEPEAYNAAVIALTECRNNEHRRWFGTAHPFYDDGE